MPCSFTLGYTFIVSNKVNRLKLLATRPRPRAPEDPADTGGIATPLECTIPDDRHVHLPVMLLVCRIPLLPSTSAGRSVSRSTVGRQLGTLLPAPPHNHQSFASHRFNPTRIQQHDNLQFSPTSSCSLAVVRFLLESESFTCCLCLFLLRKGQTFLTRSRLTTTMINYCSLLSLAQLDNPSPLVVGVFIFLWWQHLF